MNSIKYNKIKEIKKAKQLTNKWFLKAHEGNFTWVWKGRNLDLQMSTTKKSMVVICVAYEGIIITQNLI